MTVYLRMDTGELLATGGHKEVEAAAALLGIKTLKRRRSRRFMFFASDIERRTVPKAERRRAVKKFGVIPLREGDPCPCCRRPLGAPK